MAPQIQPRLAKRQTALILVILALPCLVLTGLGLRVNEQEKQLAVKRAEKERERRVAQFRSDLLSELERVKRQALAQRNADVVIGSVHQGTLVLPFEEHQRARQFRSSFSAAFGDRIRQGENEEFGIRRFGRAVEFYREALMHSRHPGEKAYAALLLARASQKAGRRAEAIRQYKAVLACPSELTDEYGVQLALYAAAPLLEAGNEAEVAAVISEMMRDPSRLGPQSLYKIREVTDKIEKSALLPQLERLIREREQAEALQADMSRLLPRLAADDTVWLPYSDPLRLISLARGGSGRQSMIAVPASQLSVLTRGPAETVRIEQGKEGESLGDHFPGLRGVFPPLPVEHSSLGRMFLTLALVFVMALTLFAGWLLWRDMRLNARLSELRSQFVASVSHELRTPLTSIRMFTESMQMDDEMDPETRAKYLETVLHECARLSRLVENVLHFARIEQIRTSYNLRPISAIEVVEHAMRAFSQPSREAGFRLEVKTPSSLPEVLADRDALEQAILNLLGNAMKYSGDSREITLRVVGEDGFAAISITDYGIGIAPEEQSRIFERFYRAATPENQQIPGTGLGLTLVEHIVKGHGGGILVKSQPQAGTTFTIRIPFHSNAAVAKTVVAEQV